MIDRDKNNPATSDREAAFRILDANLNRAREALRTIEDFARFIRNDAVAAAQCKRGRHRLTRFAKAFEHELLQQRDTVGDVGTTITTTDEIHRLSTNAVAKAALGRLTEALRCIEEYGKIISPAHAETVEQIRYGCYTLGQRLFERHAVLDRIRSARLHLLLTEALCRNDWQATALAALRGGADVIQLREKDVSDSILLQRANWLRRATEEHDALFIVNDRADIARLANADGVHLGQDDVAPSEARQILGPLPLIGVSTHSLSEATDKRAAHADYLGVGTMFASSTKPNVAVRGPALLAEISDAIEHVPLVAIGGITAENVPALMDIAPKRTAIAVSQAILGATDAEAATRSLLASVTSARPMQSQAR